MNKNEIASITELVADKKLNNDILIRCVSSLRKEMGRVAWEGRKWLYVDGDKYKVVIHNLKVFEGRILKILREKYCVLDIDKTVKALGESGMLNARLRDMVLELINSKDFTLV